MQDVTFPDLEQTQIQGAPDHSDCFYGNRFANMTLSRIAVCILAPVSLPPSFVFISLRCPIAEEVGSMKLSASIKAYDFYL